MTDLSTRNPRISPPCKSVGYWFASTKLPVANRPVSYGQIFAQAFELERVGEGTKDLFA